MKNDVDLVLDFPLDFAHHQIEPVLTTFEPIQGFCATAVRLERMKSELNNKFMNQEIELFVLFEDTEEPRSFKLKHDAVVDDLLKLISSDRHHELSITIVGEDAPCERNHRLHPHHGSYVHCHHHAKRDHHHKRRVEVIVNGKPEQIGYVPQEQGAVLVKRALEKSHNSGQNPENWQLRDAAGNILDQSKRVGAYGLKKDSKLFLNLKAGGGGNVA